MTGLDTVGRSRQTWLNPDRAARLLTEEPEDDLLRLDTSEFHDAVRHKRAELDAEVPANADGVLAWAAAAAAGVPVTAQQHRTEELLRSHETFVEDLFGTLLDRSGFAQPTRPSPAP